MGSAQVAFYGILVLIAGLYMGWHARRVHTVHRELRTLRARIPTVRRLRLTGGLTLVTMLAITLLAIRALAR